jgi:hypothetical protein
VAQAGLSLSHVINEAELTVSLPDKAPLIARCSGGKDSLHEKKALLLGQLYVGPKSLWAPFECN